MLKFIRKILGYKEVVVVKKTLDVKKGYKKAYGISWKNVFFNFKELLKKWPRKGSYKRFYFHNYIKPDNVLGYIEMTNIKSAIEYNPNKDSLSRPYLHGYVYPDLQNTKNK
jgi:hypothetical protein